jgi:hypothetical protein
MAKEYCDRCGEEIFRCVECGNVIKKNKGWVIHLDYEGTGRPVRGSYHVACLDHARASLATSNWRSRLKA